jgi:predicted RNA-binding protein YlxR (DUF448 family)
MRSLKRIFNKIKERNPLWSDYICFSEAVRGKKFSRKTIARHFNSLVDKGDYAKSEKKEILRFLVELSKSG